MVVCRVRFTLTHARTYNIHRFPTDLCGIRSKIATIIWLTKHYVLVFVESDLLLCIKQSKQSPWLLITCGFSLPLPFVSLTPTSHLDGLILLLALHKWSQYIDRNSERTNTWSTRVVVVDRQPQLRRLTSKRVQQLSRRFFYRSPWLVRSVNVPDVVIMMTARKAAADGGRGGRAAFDRPWLLDATKTQWQQNNIII